MKKRKQSQPVFALDVAAYILANHTNNSSIQAWRMHRFLFLCQVWSMIRDEQLLFREEVIASPKGVVIKELYPQHVSQLYVGGSTIGNLNHLSARQVDTIDFAMKKYCTLTLEQLDELITAYPPCKEAQAKRTSLPIDFNCVTLPHFFR